MMLLLFFQKSAPGTVGLTFLVIGILILLLVFDWLYSFLKTKYQKHKEQTDLLEEEQFKSEFKEPTSVSSNEEIQ